MKHKKEKKSHKSKHRSKRVSSSDQSDEISEDRQEVNEFDGIDDLDLDSPIDSVDLPSPSDLPQKMSEKESDRERKHKDKSKRKDKHRSKSHKSSSNGSSISSFASSNDSTTTNTKLNNTKPNTMRDDPKNANLLKKDNSQSHHDNSSQSHYDNSSQYESNTNYNPNPQYNTNSQYHPNSQYNPNTSQHHPQYNINTSKYNTQYNHNNYQYNSHPNTQYNNSKYDNVSEQIKGSTKAELIVEAKKEYTAHLHLLIDNFFYDEFEALYQHCLKTPQSENPLKDFLSRLRRIPAASDHYKARIIDRYKKSGGDENTLIGLLKALFITHVQLLLSIRTDANKKAFQVDIPQIKDFLFQCMTEIAKGLYELYSSNSDRNYQKNMIVIKQAIEQAVTKHIPIKQILFSFREDNSNPNNVTIIPCTPIISSYNSSTLGNMIRSPVVNQTWIPHSPMTHSEHVSVNLKEQKVKDDATLTQIDDLSDKDDDFKQNEAKAMLKDTSPPSPSIESESNEIRTIRTGNDNEINERQGSKELNIKL